MTFFLILITSLLFLSPYFLIIDLVNIGFLVYSFLSIFTFVTFVFLLNKGNVKLKKYKFFALMLLSFIYLSSICIQVFYFNMTGGRIDYLFWDTFSLSLINSTLLTHLEVYIYGFIYAGICLGALFSLLKYRNKRIKSRIAHGVSVIISMALMLCLNFTLSPVLNLWNSYGVYRYRNVKINYLEKPMLISEVEFKPQKGKNIVHIILESHAKSFSNNSIYPNLTPRINELIKDGVLIENMMQLDFEKSSFYGLSLSHNGRFSTGPIKEQEVTLPKALKNMGYKNIFIRGAEENPIVNHKYLYGEGSGFDEVISKEDLLEKYRSDSLGGWGFSDEIIFAEALKIYRDLNSKDKSFSLSIFTLDSHGGDQEVSSSCLASPYKGGGKEIDVLQGIHCTDALLGGFIDELKKLPKYDNTLIVIHGDHLPWNDIAYNDNRIFSLVLNGEGHLNNQKQETYLYDIPQTIIENIGVDNNVNFPLGENILSDFVREKKYNSDFDKDPIPLFITKLKYMNKIKLMSYIAEGISDKGLLIKKDGVEVSYMKDKAESFNGEAKEKESLYVYSEIRGANKEDVYYLCAKRDYSFLSTSYIDKGLRHFQSFLSPKMCVQFGEQGDILYAGNASTVTSLWKKFYIKKNGKKWLEL